MSKHSAKIVVDLPPDVVWSEFAERADWPGVKHTGTDPPDGPIKEGSTLHYELGHISPNTLVVFIETLDHLNRVRVDVIVEAPLGAHGSSTFCAAPDDDPNHCSLEATFDISFGQGFRARLVASAVSRSLSHRMARELRALKEQLEQKCAPPVPPASPAEWGTVGE